MSLLICGSIAYDNIMVFQDRFKNHILPEQIHILNVAFLVPELRREFGGCAGNIAYNLKLLDEKPLIMATVGSDAAPYLEHLHALQIDTQHIKQLSAHFTAQAFITTDLDDNQITAFHPGAMSESHANSIAEASHISLAIVAPDGREGMLTHANDLAARSIPFIFDPGQGMPMFSGEELLHFMALADYACFNDYEAKMLCDRTGLPLGQLVKTVKALIVTQGAAGSTVYTTAGQHHIPCVTADNIVDPTGCGDAYRAGLLYGLKREWDVVRAAQLASVMGAFKIGSQGGQNHAPTRHDISLALKTSFGHTL